MADQQTQILRAFYLFCFLLGIMGTPLYFTFCLTLTGEQIYDPTKSYWVWVVLIPLLTLPLIKVVSLNQKLGEGWKLVTLVFLLVDLGYFGVDYVIVRTLFHWYMNTFAEVWERPSRWFGPMLLIPTVILAAWAEARLRNKMAKLNTGRNDHVLKRTARRN